MLARLSGKADYAHKQAKRSAAMARHADKALRAEYLQLETHWLILAASFEHAERISGFLEWSSQRVKYDDNY